MELKKELYNFSNDELLSLISSEIKTYLPKEVEKKNIVDYIYKNIHELIEEKKFIEILFSNLSKVHNLSSITPQIKFFNDKVTKESKKVIQKFLNIKYENEKVNSEIECNCLLPKRFYELLDYQALIKEKVTNFVTENNQNEKHVNKLIIHMPTGTGKTKTCVHTIISLYQKNDNKGIIVWLAHTNELLNQAKNSFISAWNALGNKEIKIKMNDVSSINDDDCIYFISYNKLISLFKNNSEMFEKLRDNLSICVCDEAHKCLAQETFYALEEFMISYDKSHSKTMIGLTATPGRKYKDSILEGDNLDLALMFDKHIFSINTAELEIFKNYHNNNMFDEFTYNDIFNKDNEIIRYFQDRNVLAKIKRFSIKYQTIDSDELLKIFNKRRTSDYTLAELKKIGENKLRNDAIIENLKKLDARGIPTIVFACSNDQGKLLANVLTLSGIKNNCVFGDTHDSLRKQYIKDFDEGKYNILINNSILTTGFDSPRIKCVFITRPTNSIVLYSQMLGRGLRGKLMGGNEECMLIDVEDNLKKFSNENFAFNYFSVYWR